MARRRGADADALDIVRAAGLSNALLAPVVVTDNWVLNVVHRDARSLLMGLTLVYFMTLANWITAVVLDGLTLSPDGSG